MKDELHRGKPAWLKTKIPTGERFYNIKKNLRERELFTVCEEAKCPNISECWNQHSATFMIMGDTCTRGCRFCSVKTGNPNGWLDIEEPSKVAKSCAEMDLQYVVITMVDRDDLPDFGAGHIAKVVTTIREVCNAKLDSAIDKISETKNSIKIELLAGDMRGDKELLKAVLDSQPDVFAHNIETVERLTPRVRDARATYRKSLEVLRVAKEIADYQVFTKSALMLGLGEELSEIEAALKDLRDVGVDFITIGQYMRPSHKHLTIKRWVTPKEFDEVGQLARSLGFLGVASSPLVRSSYKAKEFYEKAMLEVSKNLILNTSEPLSTLGSSFV
ncbi:MAG: lipoyl synthase [Oligoflexales bacterium]|nr:lipoyl synthase [Oligoflexales bacterium]